MFGRGHGRIVLGDGIDRRRHHDSPSDVAMYIFRRSATVDPAAPIARRPG